MSWFNFSTTEAEVLSIITKLKLGAQEIEAEIATGLKWVASNATTINSDLVVALGFANQLSAAGITIPPSVVTAAQNAAAGIAAVAAAQASGKNSADTLMAGYTAVKQAAAAHAQAAIAVATASPAATAAMTSQ